MVCPLLEYDNTIWGPHYIEDRRSVEKIQRRATKIISGRQNFSYEERLLNLPLLKYRKKCGDLIYCYKIIQTSENHQKPLFYASWT